MFWGPACIAPGLQSTLFFFRLMQRVYQQFPLQPEQPLIERILDWGRQHYGHMALLNTNGWAGDKYSRYSAMIAMGVADQLTDTSTHPFEEILNCSTRSKDWWFGFLGYDLKNHLENLHSRNTDRIGMPDIFFFRPQLLFLFENNQLQLGYLNLPQGISDPQQLMEMVLQHQAAFPQENTELVQIRHTLDKAVYLEKVQKVKQHIQQGDIYEMNFCMEFFAEHANISPLQTYFRLNERSPAPYSAFFQLEKQYLMSSSPERFMCKQGQKIISQPIKGTIRRGIDACEDQALRQQLYNDPKERSENVMIVDLVRNDLSRTAQKGSVKVEELFGIYSFPQVHQMISTVTSLLRQDSPFTQALKEAFPMGSMTGAPKISAMQIIEELEQSKRGLYSGAVGYITPEQDFDFNVVIRSILYNEQRKTLSFMAGSAITIASDPESEYQECLLKAKAMASTLGSQLEPLPD